MKFIKLLTHAYVNGVLRSPAEGVLHLEDGEAQRLLDDKAGEDVSADFTAEQDQEVPTENVSAADEPAPSDLEPGEPQAEQPVATEPEKPAPAKKAAAKKES